MWWTSIFKIVRRRPFVELIFEGRCMKTEQNLLFQNKISNWVSAHLLRGTADGKRRLLRARMPDALLLITVNIHSKDEPCFSKGISVSFAAIDANRSTLLFLKSCNVTCSPVTKSKLRYSTLVLKKPNVLQLS